MRNLWWRAVQNNLAVISRPLLQVIIDAEPKTVGLPTEAYRAVEEVHDDGSPTTKTFEHVASEIGAEEAEEVGVEHLLRWVEHRNVLEIIFDTFDTLK